MRSRVLGTPLVHISGGGGGVGGGRGVSSGGERAGSSGDRGRGGGVTIDFSVKFKRLDYMEALEAAAGVKFPAGGGGGGGCCFFFPFLFSVRVGWLS